MTGKQRMLAALAGEPADVTPVGIDYMQLYLAERIERARAIAAERSGILNADLDDVQLHESAPLSDAAERLLRAELERGRLTGRGYHRVRRVARTLADLAGEVDAPIDEAFIATALMMRTNVGLGALRDVA